MSLRTFILCLFCLLGACASDEKATAGLANEDAGPEQLEFVRGAEIGLLPNSTATLAVRYSDSSGGNVEGIAVDFALTGSAPGASLSPARAVTDSAGMAQTELRVGSTVGDLEVRAKSANGRTGYVRVSVGEALRAQLLVSVSYTGKRQIASYTVTSLPGMTCAAALSAGLAGDVSFTFPSGGTNAVGFDLGSGLSAALVGFGFDGTNAKLAVGCKEISALITADKAMAQQQVVIPLQDQPLLLDDSLAIELQLSVAAASKRLADTAGSAVDAALTPTAGPSMFAEADVYLDAVQAALTSQGDGTALAALAAQRSGNALAAALTPTLEQAGVGFRVVGTQVRKLLGERGTGITLASTYQTGVLGPVTALGALSADGSKLLALPTLGLPRATISASFSPDTAQLLIQSLRIELPLGSYGVALLTAVEAEASAETGNQLPAPSEQKPSSLVSLAGCSTVFGPWWSQQPVVTAIPVATAVSACQARLSELTASIQTQLSTLDAESDSVLLTGSVQVQDRSEDGEVDDLGPTSLSGSWGGDTTIGALRVPVRTAFAR